MDIISRLIEMLQECEGSLSEESARTIELQLRSEFKGERIHLCVKTPREQLQDQILQMHNGRNSKEIARKLGISLATVYRALNAQKTELKKAQI